MRRNRGEERAALARGETLGLTRGGSVITTASMKHFSLTFALLAIFSAVCFAGPEYSGKEMKQVAVPPPCPEWYGTTEWNVGIWGAYAFTGTESDRTGIED